jgi:hypothetical protein
LHNKPAGCGATEAYASGPGRDEEEEKRTYRPLQNCGSSVWILFHFALLAPRFLSFPEIFEKFVGTYIM